jgi:hypothetical protein
MIVVPSDCFPPMPLAMQGGFQGECMVYPTLSNGHTIRILYRDSQLKEVIYPDLIRTFQEGGFQAIGDWWDLIQLVSVGGTISLAGPRYPNPKKYRPETMKDVFMLAERNLAHALVTTIFSKEVPFGCSPISFEEVQGRFNFDTRNAFRCATFVIRARNGLQNDLYRITIEGTENDLAMHRFTFEPSITWLCRRFPETFQLTSSTGEALDHDPALNSDPPLQAVMLTGKPAAGTCGGGGGDDGGPNLSAASGPPVRDLKSKPEFV